ncbi:MAG: CDP-alcohol phosphatidyltransferase family protein [Treponema sp.]|nr:CDP-alcohol phosphatidyltransferase family protein [Treponema sp.]
MAKTLEKKPVVRKKEKIQTEKVIRKHRRLKYIAVLPTAVTLLNAFCGFLSIVYASKGPGIFLEVFLLRKTGVTFFAMSGYLILFAMIADVLDGQVARWSGTSSGFGGQLDSLSDVISFGVAPAFLMFKIMELHFGLETFVRKFFFPVSLWKAFPSVSTQLAQLAGSWILFVAIFYMLCAVIRLARFNVENDADLAHHQNFAGLPSPASAGVIVSLVIFQEDFIVRIANRWPELSSFLMDLTSWLLPFSVLCCGILMVTRIRYAHLANRLLRRKKSFVSVMLVLFVGLLAVWNIQLAILFGFWSFALIGFVRGIIIIISRKITK